MILRIYKFVYKTILFFGFVFILNNANAQQSTWSDQVACIVYSRCSNCHNSNGSAPFSLMSYSEAYSWSAEIKTVVNTGYMPPWPPDENYVSLAHERTLTQHEIDLINNWVDGGAPSGNLNNEPTAPVFNSSFEIPNPSMVLRFPDYTVPTITSDLYRCLVVTNTSSQPQYITGFEVVPGNRNIVHHALIMVDTTGQSLTLDAADPNPGYSSFGGIGVNGARLISVWVPGAGATFFPSGMGVYLPPNCQVVAQIHYPLGTTGQSDSTSIRLLTTTTTLRNITITPVLNHSSTLTNGPLVIPANTENTFHSQRTIPAKVTTLGVGPHAHLLCESLKTFGVNTNGDTVKLIDIPNWDFHWQGFYHFRKPIIVNAGTVLHGLGHYNNTTSNPNNPSSPPQLVTSGESTTEEMMLFYFMYTPYQSGDENIVVDTVMQKPYQNCSVVSSVEENSVNTFRVFPNPSAEYLVVQSEDAMTQIIVKDVNGRLIYNREFEQFSIYKIDEVKAWPASVYFVEIKTKSGLYLHQKAVVGR